MAPINPAFLTLRQAVRPFINESKSVILLGVSGGSDSMSLAAAVLKERNNKRAIPVVVDHGLQKGSAETANIVRERLMHLGFTEVFVARANVEMKDGLEASARRARYKVFEMAIETYGADTFLLAHNKNDQAEGVLLGLARGSGTKSLSGMREKNGIYVRPFLNISKEIILQACTELGMDFWSDPHNENLEFTRVRVRQNVIPHIESEIGPGIVDALSRSARILGEDAQALDEWAERIISLQGLNNLEIEKLLELPKAVRARVLRRAIYAAGAPNGSLTAEHLEPVEALVTAWKGQGECSLPGGVKVLRISGRLSLSN